MTNQPLVVLGDEELFCALLTSPAFDERDVLFARTVPEAATLCRTRAPELLIVPLDHPDPRLPELVRAARRRGVDSLGEIGAAASTAASGVCDWEAVRAPGLPFVVEAVRLTLEVRRGVQRLATGLHVHVSGVASDPCIVLGETALFVRTPEPLRSGAHVSVSLVDGGGRTAQAGALAVLVARGAGGEHESVLTLDGPAPEAWALLRRASAPPEHRVQRRTGSVLTNRSAPPPLPAAVAHPASASPHHT